MISKIQKWGNSQGVRIPKNILTTANIKEDENINIKTENGKIIIEKIVVRKNIKELFENFDGQYQPIDTKEIDFGEPVGKEIW